MSNTEEFLSLTQGQRFHKKKYNDIKKRTHNSNKYNKEGFTSGSETGSGSNIPVLLNEYKGSIQTNAQNHSDMAEVQALQTKYNDLLTQYNTLTNQVKTNTQGNMDKISPSNPYLGKNITLGSSSLPVVGSGTGGYVTSQGIFKNYPDTNIRDTTIGKNGCPVDFTKNVQVDKYSQLLTQGADMVQGQSCGYENSNVYVSSLTNSSSASNIGCYNNAEMVNTLLVPKMNSTNLVNGFLSSASSTYTSNNTTFGPWNAFDQNINTYWHSEYPRYSNGQYTGTISLSVVKSDGTTAAIQGEFLAISMPGVNTSNPSPVTLTSYDIQGRQDCCGANPMTANGRNPHTWYIVGYNNSDKKWYEVDYQDTTTTNANYNKSMISYKIPSSNQKPYSSYAIIVTAVGDNSAPSSTKTCVQISSWNLYTSTAATGNNAMIDSNLGFTTIDNCQSYALDNGYQFYAMQAQQSDGTATCMVSNDKTQIVAYGEPAAQVTTVPMWASNTPGSSFTSATISPTGQLTLSDGSNMKTLNDVPTVTTTTTDTSSTSSSNYYLMLQPDGNMILYNGQPGNDSTVVFSTQTSGQQQGKNNDWIASKGKYGKPYLLSGQVLNKNEWIGSADGSMRLMLQSDGNLVLQTSATKKGCVIDKASKKTYGATNVNAVYQIDNVGYANNLGNIGYVDKDTVLHSYPSSMIGYSSDYTIYDNYDAGGNDISQVQTTGIDDCKTQCNNYDNNGCAGFVFEKGSNICYLKGAGTYPKSPRQYNKNLTLAIRKPTITNGPYSGFKMNEIDSVLYQNYPKGDDMTTSTDYNAAVIDDNTKNQITQVQNQLTSVAGQLATKMEEMDSQNKNVAGQMNMNDAQFKDKILQYKNTSSQLSNNNNSNSNNIQSNIQGKIQGKKEGMQNLSINDVNGMLQESDLRVLQENYGYIFWSILAVGLLTVTVNVMKKQE